MYLPRNLTPATIQPAPNGINYGNRKFYEPRIFMAKSTRLFQLLIPSTQGIYAILVPDQQCTPRQFAVLYFGEAGNLITRQSARPSCSMPMGIFASRGRSPWSRRKGHFWLAEAVPRYLQIQLSEETIDGTTIHEVTVQLRDESSDETTDFFLGRLQKGLSEAIFRRIERGLVAGHQPVSSGARQGVRTQERSPPATSAGASQKGLQRMQFFAELGAEQLQLFTGFSHSGLGLLMRGPEAGDVSGKLRLRLASHFWIVGINFEFFN
jgi:hypothetical protein